MQVRSELAALCARAARAEGAEHAATNAVQWGGSRIVLPVVPLPDATMLDMYKDFVLFGGQFGWFFYFALCGFCAANARAILSATPKINFFHGCALMVLANFGGSTMAAIMCGKPVVFALETAISASRGSEASDKNFV